MKMNTPIVSLHGPMGDALRTTVENRLKKVDYDLLESPFRNRDEADGGWRCEFWGKIVRSAILANNSLRDPEFAEIIRKTVYNMIATQTEDGCISSYPVEKQTNSWDIWGRKYVLLALVRYYETVEQDEKIKLCCVRMLDHLMSQIGPDKKDIRRCGDHNGLAASSILGAVVAVYRISGEIRFLEFARYIAGSGCSLVHNVFAAARAGVPPSATGNGKAYELTSCFQGLAELYLIDRKPEYLEACEKYFHAVREREIFVTGTGGLRDCCGEYWYDGKFRQTRSDSGMLGETCITATYLHYCEAVSRLFSPAVPMAEAENSFYNAVLGAMSPDGTQWIHVNPTPLTGGGAKIPADDQINRGFGTPFGGNDCCLAQGPEALALAPRMAVTAAADGAMLNLLEAMDAVFPNGDTIKVTGNYPYEPRTEITANTGSEFQLQIRIPSFCTGVELNGSACDITPGEYLKIRRKWQSSDRLVMHFDFSLKEIPAADGSPLTAVKRGPLVLVKADCPPENAPVREIWNNMVLTDYASSGRKMSAEDTLTVWMAK